MIPWTVSCQAPLSMGFFFFRQEYWREFPFPSPGILPNPGIKPASPALAGGLFFHWATREALKRPFKWKSNLVSPYLKSPTGISLSLRLNWIIKTWEVWLHPVFPGLSWAPFACLIPKQQCHALLLSNVLPVCLLPLKPFCLSHWPYTFWLLFSCYILSDSCSRWKVHP